MTAAAGLLIFFDRWLWRQPAIRSLHSRPLLRGTWHGEIASDWVDKSEQQIPPDPDVFLVVRQRFWQISVRLLTTESASASMLADLDAHKDGVCQLVYVYRSTPRAEVRDRSDVHYGAAVLGAPQNPDDGLEGDYFNDRKARGDMIFRTHFKKLVETHAAGTRLVEGAGS